MMHIETNEDFEMNTHHVSIGKSVEEIRLGKEKIKPTDH